MLPAGLRRGKALPSAREQERPDENPNAIVKRTINQYITNIYTS
jgi:hypothetical protein